MDEELKIPEDLNTVYDVFRAGKQDTCIPAARKFVVGLIERIAKLEKRNAHLEKELDAGDSWAWIRAKFERGKDKFRWYKPRTDSLLGTRYEVMGWLHCLFADADPKVFIDITLEHQKRTDEAEAELNTARGLLKRIADKTEEGPTGDPQWWREYFLFTGRHMILTEEGWEPGDCKDSCADEEVEILDEVNAPV